MSTWLMKSAVISTNTSRSLYFALLHMIINASSRLVARHNLVL